MPPPELAPVEPPEELVGLAPPVVEAEDATVEPPEDVPLEAVVEALVVVVAVAVVAGLAVGAAWSVAVGTVSVETWLVSAAGVPLLPQALSSPAHAAVTVSHRPVRSRFRVPGAGLKNREVPSAGRSEDSR